MENDQYSSCFESGKRSPTLTEQLKEISNRFKTLSAQPISMCASKTDGSCSMQFTMDSVEPKTPRFTLSSKLDFNSMVESFATPQEKFKTRSTGLKVIIIIVFEVISSQYLTFHDFFFLNIFLFRFFVSLVQKSLVDECLDFLNSASK